MEKGKARPLQKMFTAVPPSYDFLNRLLTFRMDELWRKRAACLLLKEQPARLLDICTGTGDLALRIRKMAKHDIAVTALDYSAPMLEIARKKAGKKGLHDVAFMQGDVANMPFDDHAFDAIGIAFAFRNLTFKNPDTERFLAEIVRVLKPGGRFVIVETSQPQNRLLRKLVHIYLRVITVSLGGVISGQRSAYHYLAHSAIHYFHAHEVQAMMLKKGFRTVDYRLLLNGVAAIHICLK